MGFFKRAIPKIEKKETDVPLGEMGWYNSSIYNASDFEPYNPDALIVNKGAGIYDKMMDDDQIKPVMRFKQFAVISRGWYFDIDQDKEEDHSKKAAFLETVVGKIKGNFKDKLINILSCLPHGFSTCEKIFQPITFDDKTYWGLKDIKMLPFSTMSFKTDPHGNIKEFNQGQGYKKVTIPTEKIIHHVYQPDYDPIYGKSDLRSAYRSYWSKDIAIKFQNIHLERFGTGFVTASYDGQLQPDDKTRLQNFLDNLSARAGGFFPKKVDIKVHPSVSTDNYEKALTQHDKALARSILVPNLLGLSEQGNTGSYAQSETQFKAFMWILDYEAGRLAEVLNEQLFKPLIEWNFSSDDFPQFTFEPVSDDNKRDIAKAWSELVSKGSVTKSESDEAYIRDLMGFPEKTEEEIEEPGPEDQLPEDEIPVDEDGNAIPDMNWILDKTPAQMSYIRKEFKEKLWLQRVNFTRIEKNIDTADDTLSQDMANLMAVARVSIEKQIAKIAGERSFGNVKPKEIESVNFPAGIKTDIRKTLRTQLSAFLETNYNIAKAELPKRFDKRVTPGMDLIRADKFLTSSVMKITYDLTERVISAVQQVLSNSIRYDKTLRQTILELLDSDLINYLPDYEIVTIKGNDIIRAINKPARVENIVRTSTSSAMNEARMSFFGDPDLKGYVQAYEYTAVLDGRTTDICQALHGKIFKDFGTYLPPNHFQCRSLLVPITVIDEWDGKESKPPTIKPQKGFG